MLENAVYDIILMDVEMPVMDGISAASEIRKREAEGDLPGRTPIIAVTGNARREYVDIGISPQLDQTNGSIIDWYRQLYRKTVREAGFD